MSKLRITFNVAVSYPAAQALFSAAINHWVENYQNQTSSFAKALMLGTAVDQFQHGSAFVGALALTAGKGQGVRHPTITTAKISIPASATTYGGEMNVTASPSADGGTMIEIDGHTQGLLGGTLKENVNGLRDYLTQALPTLENQYNQIQATNQIEKSATGSSVTDEIERLSNLYKSGVLNEEEFQQAKRKILAG